MVQITIQDNSDSIEMTLRGHVSMPWVAELSRTWAEMAPRLGKKMLRITIHEDDESIGMTLEGRVAGPWVDELSRTWEETAKRLGKKTLSLDLRNVTFSDAGGKQALREIYAQTNAELITGTLWAKYLAEEIKKHSADQDEENGHEFDA